MDSTTAFFHVQTQHPAHDPAAVLDFLRNHERVQYNETNQVYTWIVSRFQPHRPLEA
jgi:hypothetical protein